MLQYLDPFCLMLGRTIVYGVLLGCGLGTFLGTVGIAFSLMMDRLGRRIKT